VDFELSGDQAAILEAVDALLARHAGAERAITLARKGEYDLALEQALAEAGFLDVAGDPDQGPLEAALIVEAVARRGGVVAAGATALVAPGVGATALPRPVALARAGSAGLVRYAAHARSLLVIDGERARVVPLEAGEAEPVASSFGVPLGRLDPIPSRGEVLAAGAADRLRNWWRVSLALELSGTLRAALDLTVAYLKQRRQFGRRIASFQAVQHRLAECHVLAEGARWLALEAAWRGAPAEAAATALAYAGAAAGRVFAETHQLSGAIGYTREHDLHVFSMRLQGLRLELGGLGESRRAAARARWAKR
jgi:alkylation response protein AidB-like acyl-CoA dehydrogenase